MSNHVIASVGERATAYLTPANSGTERVLRYVFAQARMRRGSLVSATKSNGLVFLIPFWDKVVREVSREFPDVRFREMHIDALTARLVLDPTDFDVIASTASTSEMLAHIVRELGQRQPLVPNNQRSY
jgi:tartrate dehydrogenase/decarboxylase/D-malate dehydrogenase